MSNLFKLSLDPMQVFVTFAVALVIGLAIYLVYKLTFAGVMYSRSYNISLVIFTMITSLMLMIINNNLSLSLGMVGALSIIRFRTALKDPMDTVFLFWTVGEGIAIGCGYYDIALIALVVIGAALVLMTAFKTRGTVPYLLILHYGEEASAQVKQMVRQIPKAQLKSKTVRRDGVEMTIELRIRPEEAHFVDKFLRVDGVYDATLVSHQGDIVS